MLADMSSTEGTLPARGYAAGYTMKLSNEPPEQSLQPRTSCLPSSWGPDMPEMSTYVWGMRPHMPAQHFPGRHAQSFTSALQAPSPIPSLGQESSHKPVTGRWELLFVSTQTFVNNHNPKQSHSEGRSFMTYLTVSASAEN